MKAVTYLRLAKVRLTWQRTSEERFRSSRELVGLTIRLNSRSRKLLKK